MLDPNDPLAFVTGITFTNGGTFNINQQAIVTFVPDGSQVPIPGALLLFGSGLMLLRKRRNA